jgi:hypothetical protein
MEWDVLFGVAVDACEVYVRVYRDVRLSSFVTFVCQLPSSYTFPSCKPDIVVFLPLSKSTIHILNFPRKQQGVHRCESEGKQDLPKKTKPKCSFLRV